MASRGLAGTGGPSVLLVFAALVGLIAAATVVALGPSRGSVGVTLVGAGLVATVLILRHPLLGVHAVMVAGFASMGIKRAIPQLPMGLTVDALLVLLLLSIALSGGTGERLSRLRDVGVVPLVVWMGFCVTQIVNPQAPSMVAWFYAVRGIAGYMVLPLLIVLVLDNRRQLEGLVWHWCAWANLCAVWGIKQAEVGLMPFEQRWMAMGAYHTHLLHGKLRAFSILSDTAQFGITMAFSFMFFLVLASAPLGRWARLVCVVTSANCFYGCLVSGTRSAWIAVPVGFICYAMLRRRWAPVVLGLGSVAFVFCILKFTYIGQGNYNVQRMRQAVNPLEDPSFQVRLENQKKLYPYLLARPLGGGIGAAGFWGQRFSPGTFLSNLAMDSHFVRIAAEVGFGGLGVHILAMLALGLIGTARGAAIRDPVYSVIYDGHLAVFAGVFVASYSNQYLAQIPTAVIVYQGFALIILGPKLSQAASSSEDRWVFSRRSGARRPIRVHKLFRNERPGTNRNRIGAETR